MRKRLRSHEGANAVEFALILPILVILVFGIFTIGMAYNTKLVANHAVRDGARFGATLTYVDDGSGGMAAEWFEDVRDRAVEAGEGQFGSLAGGTFTPSEHAVICVAYNDGTAWRRYIWAGADPVAVNDGSSPSDACYAEDLTDERVQVQIERDAAFNIVFLPARTITLTSNSVARFEDRPAPAPSPSPTST